MLPLETTRQSPLTLKPQALPLGMSFAAFLHFVEAHPLIASASLTTGDIKRAIITAATAGTGSAFINKLEAKSDAEGRPFVAPATVFVSHAWTYEFVNVVVDVLNQYAAEHPDAYFWFDLFTVDQNKANASKGSVLSPLEAAATFRLPIEATRHVLLVMHPWDDPIPIRRAWCLFEIHTALVSPGVRMEARLPRTDVARLDARIRSGRTYGVTRALGVIRAEAAQAESKEDLAMIRQHIQASEGGFDSVNECVTNFLRIWYVIQLCTIANTGAAADAKLFGQVALLVASFQKTDDEELHKGRSRCVAYAYDGIASNGNIQPAVALSLFTSALIFLESQLEEKVALTAGETNELRPIAALCDCIGLAYNASGAHNRALEFFDKSLRLRLPTLATGGHLSVAVSWDNIGNVHRTQFDFGRALECYEIALRLRLALGDKQHADVAISYSNINLAHQALGALDDHVA